MKYKFFSIIFISFMLITCRTFANERAQRSDYRAFIDYTPIDSYVIDGYTYIDAEELVNYGFDVNYNSDTHCININRIRYATPSYSKEQWEKSTKEKRMSKIEDTAIRVYLNGEEIDCFYTDNKILIMIDNLVKCGEFNWSSWEKTVYVTIFQHELETDLDKADNVIETEYDSTITFYRKGTAKYKGQINSEGLPDGIGMAEFDYNLTKIKYLGYFKNGKPDGLIYKETFHTVSRSYVMRYVHFIGEIDGSKSAKREYLSDKIYGVYDIASEPNFGAAVLPIQEIDEWTGPELLPDRDVYIKGCYYETWDGKEGKHEYRIWSDGEGTQTITDTIFYGAYNSEDIDRYRLENENIKYMTDFYDYKNYNLVSRNSYLYTVAGEPVVLNSPEHGARTVNPKIEIFINDKLIVGGVAPIIENDRVLVPLTVIFENLGAKVSWDEKTQTVSAVKGDRTISLQINSEKMYINNEMFVLDVVPVIYYDTTMVPVRAVAQALGAQVNWNGRTKQVEIVLE